MSLHRGTSSLDPSVRPAAEAAIAELRAKGIPFFVNETLRDKAVQYCYWLQGRGNPLELVNYFRGLSGLYLLSDADNSQKVTWTVISNHLTGCALDIVPANAVDGPNWSAPIEQHQAIATVMKAHGFKWGGDWPDPGKDLPHYEMV